MGEATATAGVGRGAWRIYAALAAATFSQHAGLLFLFVTVPVTLRQQGASLTQVSLFALVFVPFALQFLWAPFVERARMASAAGWRPWFLATQAVLVIGFGLAALVPLEPDNLLVLIGLAVVLAVAGGTQKVAMGGLAIEALGGADRAAGNAALGAGSALGSVVGTIGLVWLYGAFGWGGALATAALLTLVAGLVYLPLPRVAAVRDETAAPSLVRLFRRSHTWRRIGRLGLIGVPLGLAFGLVQPRLADAGLDLQAVGLVNGLGQLAMWVLAAPLITWLVRRFGPDRALAVTLVATGALFAGVAAASFLRTAAIAAAVASACAALLALIGVSIATYTGLMREAESGNQAATEFSVYLSLYGLMILSGAGASGLLADWGGYGFVLTIAAILTLTAAIIVRSGRKSHDTVDHS